MTVPASSPVLDVMNVGGDGTHVRLRWTPVADAALTGYHVFTAATDAALTTAEGTTPLATVPAANARILKPTTILHTLAYFSVTAYNASGDSLPSNHVHITPTADADSLTYTHILKAS